MCSGPCGKHRPKMWDGNPKLYLFIKVKRVLLPLPQPINRKIDCLKSFFDFPGEHLSGINFMNQLIQVVCHPAFSAGYVSFLPRLAISRLPDPYPIPVAGKTPKYGSQFSKGALAKGWTEGDKSPHVKRYSNE